MADNERREPDEVQQHKKATLGKSKKPNPGVAPLAFEEPDYLAMNEMISETRKQAGPELDYDEDAATREPVASDKAADPESDTSEDIDSTDPFPQ